MGKIFDNIFFRGKSAVERTEIQGLSVSMASLGEYGITDAIPRNPSEVTPELAAGIFAVSPYVNACTRIIADAVACTPIQVIQKTRSDGKETVLVKGVLADLFSWINPSMTLHQFLSDVASWLVIKGDAYIAIEPTSTEYTKISPVSLYPMNPQYISIVPDPDTHVDRYIYTVNGKKAMFDKDKVIHIRNWNPYNHWFGYSSLNSLQYDIQMERFAKKQTGNFYANAATVSGVLSIAGESSDDEIRKLKREFNYQYSGARNSHRVLILTEGMQYEPIKSFGIENNSVPILEETLKNHAMVLGVPVPILSGDSSNILEYERLMWKRTIIPMQSLIESTLTKMLCPTDSRYLIRIAFDRSNVEALRTEDLDRTRVDVALVQAGIYTINEVRRDRKMPEFTDSKIKEFADTPMPLWMQENPAVSASLTLPGSRGGRDQSANGEAQMIDQTGKRGLALPDLTKGDSDE